MKIWTITRCLKGSGGDVTEYDREDGISATEPEAAIDQWIEDNYDASITEYLLKLENGEGDTPTYWRVEAIIEPRFEVQEIGPKP